MAPGAAVTAAPGAAAGAQPGAGPLPAPVDPSCAPAGLSPADRRYSCAVESQARDEPVLGTASPTRGWWLVEEPGAWGPGTVPASRIGPDATAALLAAARAASGRLLLVRRPGGGRRDDGGTRFVARVSCVRGRARVLTRTAPADDLLAAMTTRDGWTELTGEDAALLLVCTHGRKDWCCARRGRPLAAALAELAPQRVWECSHLGGDRFAANVLSLPSGWTYGRVDVVDAPEVVAASAAGGVVARLARGRCSDAMVVQAADVHARLHGAGGSSATGGGVDDLVPVSARREDELTWRVELDDATTGRRLAVRVRQGHVASAQRLTCGAAEAQHARTWDLVDISDGLARTAAPEALAG